MAPGNFWRAWQAKLAFACLLIVTAAAYVPSLTGEFQFDDTPVVEKIERHDVTLAQLLRGDAVSRPLVYLTLLADYKIAGLDVRVFHATNVLFHLATVVLVLLFTQVTLRGIEWPSAEAIALAVAGLFALHPLQTQAVSYVVQRAEVLASLFYLATMLFLLRSEAPIRRWQQAGSYVAALIAFLLGLGAKDIIITVPVAYAVHRLLFANPQKPARWAGIALRALPFAAITAYVIWGSIRGAAGRVDIGFDVPLLPPARYLLTQMAVVPTYLRLLVWPAGQNIEHDFPLSQGLGDVRTLLGLAVLAAIGALAVWLFNIFRRSGSTSANRVASAALFGLAWFFLLLAPTSTVVPLADVMVEHRVYLASWGIFLCGGIAAAAWLETAVRAENRRAVALTLMVLIGGALFTATQQRNRVWSNRLALWADAANKSPNKARARSNHAHALRMAGRPAEASREYVAALRLVGENPSLLHGLSGALYEAGDLQNAMRFLQRALVLQPNNSIALNDLAIYLAAEKKFADAESAARQALAADPRNALAHLTLGNIRLERGDPQSALHALAQAEALAPHLGTPALSSAMAHGTLGDRFAACGDLERYLKVKRETPQVREIARAFACPRFSESR